MGQQPVHPDHSGRQALVSSMELTVEARLWKHPKLEPALVFFSFAQGFWVVRQLHFGKQDVGEGLARIEVKRFACQFPDLFFQMHESFVGLAEEKRTRRPANCFISSVNS